MTGGGVAGDDWLASRHTEFLVPTPALASLVRGKLKAMLAKHCPGVILPKAIWTKRWVVHATAWGEGAAALLRYLARYVFRTAITNNRLVSDETGVAFRHTALPTGGALRAFSPTSSCAASSSMSGLHKVRYFGLWHPAKRDIAVRVRLLLHLEHRNLVSLELSKPHSCA